MIGCLRTCVRKQPIIALYFEFENELKFYNLEARSISLYSCILYISCICFVFVTYALTLPVSGLSFMSIKLCSVLFSIHDSMTIPKIELIS